MSLEPKKSSILVEVIIFVLFALGPLTGNVILVLFGVLSKEFNATPSALLISIPAFMVPFAIIQLFSGAISDVKGRIPVMIFGLIIFGFGWFIAAISFTLLMFVVANILAGIGFGFVNPVLIALMTDITPPGPEIPKKMGYLGASANLGVGIGPLIASQMILIGWQSIYVLFIVITCFCLVYFILAKRASQKRNEESGIRVLLIQLSKEWRRFPVILMILSAFLISHTYIAINIWTSKTLTQAHTVNETLIGIVLGLAGIGAAITGILTGNLIKSKGAKIPLSAGSLILLCSLVILLIIGDVSTPERFTILALGWILVGFSGGILFTLITYYSQVLSPERRGALAGLLTASYFTGIALVPTTLAPFSYTYGISGVYIAILITSIIFIMAIFLLYFYAKPAVSEKKKAPY